MTWTDHRIQAGGYSAVFTVRAGALRRLRHGDRDLVLPFPAGGPIPDFRGIIAAPWPNRIAEGRYSFDGETHQLPVNEPERGCALHGLGLGQDWTVEARGESSLALSCALGPTPGYPFALRLTASYRVDGDGLHAEVAATNAGDRAAPYGICPHPYLLAGPAPLDQWTLGFQADTFLATDPERRLPAGRQPVSGHAYDFHTPPPHRRDDDRQRLHRAALRRGRPRPAPRPGPRRQRRRHVLGPEPALAAAVHRRHRTAQARQQGRARRRTDELPAGCLQQWGRPGAARAGGVAPGRNRPTKSE